MKIVHVGLDVVPSSGGSVESIRDFTSVLPSIVISFTSPRKLETEATAIPGTIHIEVYDGFIGRAFAWTPTERRRAALEAVANADLIICHILLRYHVHWVKAIAKEKKIPYWVVPHGCLDPYVFSYRTLIKRVWFFLFGQPFLKGADKVVFATQKERLKASRYFSGENNIVIHWPVKPIDCARRDLARRRIREDLQIPVDDKVLLYMGRLHDMKRPIETITAFAMAHTNGMHLVLVGPDETVTQEQCLMLVHSLHVPGVHLLGAIYGDDKNDYLLGSDGFISLSYRENFGYTTAEALSAGLPVILSPGNDLADELVSHGCGWMLKDNQLETAATAIREFSAVPFAQLREMGTRGRSWALDNLGFEKFAEQVRLVATESIGHFKSNIK